HLRGVVDDGGDALGGEVVQGGEAADDDEGVPGVHADVVPDELVLLAGEVDEQARVALPRGAVEHGAHGVVGGGGHHDVASPLMSWPTASMKCASPTAYAYAACTVLGTLAGMTTRRPFR